GSMSAPAPHRPSRSDVDAEVDLAEPAYSAITRISTDWGWCECVMRATRRRGRSSAPTAACVDRRRRVAHPDQMGRAPRPQPGLRSGVEGRQHPSPSSSLSRVEGPVGGYGANVTAQPVPNPSDNVTLTEVLAAYADGG